MARVIVLKGTGEKIVGGLIGAGLIAATGGLAAPAVLGAGGAAAGTAAAGGAAGLAAGGAAAGGAGLAAGGAGAAGAAGAATGAAGAAGTAANVGKLGQMATKVKNVSNNPSVQRASKAKELSDQQQQQKLMQEQEQLEGAQASASRAREEAKIATGEPMNLAWRLLKERVSPEAIAHKLAYDKKYESSPERVKYREELNRERRRRHIMGQGGPDMSHTKDHTIVPEDPHTNRARHFKEKGTLL